MSVGRAPARAIGHPATSPAPERARFGSFARFGEVFALIFAGRPGLFFGFGGLMLVIPAALAAAAGFGITAALGIDPTVGVAAPWIDAVIAVAFGLGALVGAGVMVMAGGDWRAGRRRGLWVYLGRTLRRLHVAAVLSAVVLALVLAGCTVIGLVGLWVAAVYSVVLPAVLCEDAPWGALGRSRTLTRGYRGPIAGLLVLVQLAPIALYVIAVAVGGPSAPASLKIASAALGALSPLIVVPLSAAASAVTYARLRAMEGEGGDLGAVFA